MRSGSFDEWVDRILGQPLSSAQLEYIRKKDPALYYNYILMEATVEDKRRIEKKDVTMRGPYIPFLEGRPERYTAIGAEDIIDLLIIINTTTTVNEFLEAL